MDNLFSWFNSDVGIGAALGYSVFGMIMVFLMLIILMVVINIMAALIKKGTKKTETVAETVKPVVQKEEKPAPGSAGGVKLYDVPDRTAAMIMAIVADKMGKPLNELRFISIREVKDDEV